MILLNMHLKYKGIGFMPTNLRFSVLGPGFPPIRDSTGVPKWPTCGFNADDLSHSYLVELLRR